MKHQFIPYGATLTNLFVNDKSGKEVDVVLGYDDASYYREALERDLVFYAEFN